MTARDNDTENRINLLFAEISDLKIQLHALQTKVDSLSSAGATHLPPIKTTYIRNQGTEVAASEDDKTPLLDSVSLLSKISAVCFILVIALILRTFTDNEIIHKQTGSYLGMVYAAFLVLYGWRRLALKKNLASIFPFCGVLLMFSIVMETHGSFHAISSQTAYGILFLTLLAANFIGMRFKLVSLTSLGILGSSIVALTIDFPNPIFPLLMIFLYLTTLITFKSKLNQPRWGWTGWSFHFITLFAWLMWTIKIRVVLLKAETLGSQLFFPWFFPLLLVFAATYMTLTVAKSFLTKTSFHNFDLALPTLTVFWAYATAWLIISPWQGSTVMLGITGSIWALLHFALAGLIFKSSQIGKSNGSGVCVYTFAGSMLLIVSLPDAVGSILISLVAWSALGLILARLAAYCEIGGIRLSSYLLQVLACLAFILSGKFMVRMPSPAVLLLIIGSLTAMSIWQYGWCRSHPLHCSSGFFKRIDPSDHSAVFILVAAVVNGYLSFQLAAQAALTHLLDDYSNALLGAQSVIINIGAIILLLLALSRRSKELLSVSILAVVVGALKVFGYDFFESSGIPLVLSVFSFGAVAAVGSFIIKRWQQQSLTMSRNEQ